MNLKQAALYQYRNGHNCSQCLLAAAAQVYSLPSPPSHTAMLEGISTGFGIGGICSAIVAGIMIFGLLFDEDTAKRLRLKLIDDFKSANGSLNCCELMGRRGGGYYCEKLIGDAAELIERLIAEER